MNSYDVSDLDTIKKAVEENGYGIMVTGHRTIKYPKTVIERLDVVLKKTIEDHSDKQCFAIFGGADGADQIWAEVAIGAHCPFKMYLPNWAYPFNYRLEEDLRAIVNDPLALYLGVHYSKDREEVPNWKDLWGRQKWWLDNFKRNEDMINDASLHVIVSNFHPNEVFLRKISGGTAAAIRSMRKSVDRAVWIDSSADDTEAVRWINILK